MLWNQTQNLPPEAFKRLEEKYREAGFFIEVRLQLPDFVESNFMPSNEQQIDDTTAANLATQLLGQLEAKIAQIPNDPDKYMSKTKLSEMYEKLKGVYAENLVQLYIVVRQCLEHEKEIVSQHSAASPPGFVPAEGDIASQIRQHLSTLRTKISECGAELDRIRQEQEAFSMEYYTFKEMDGKVQNMKQQLGEENPETKRLVKQHTSMNNSIRTRYISLTTKRGNLTSSYKQIFDVYREVQAQVLEKQLINWKRDQQLAGNGHDVNMGQLEILQEWCEGLADIIWTMRQQLSNFNN